MKIYLYPGDSIDSALAIRQPKEIILAPGRYYTKGIWYHGADWEAVISPGTTIRVDNGRADICLSDKAQTVMDGVERPDLQVMTGRDFTVEGVTFDGQQSVFGSERLITSGLRWKGSARLVDCQVRGLRGSYAQNVEAFGFSCHGPEGTSTLTTCRVTNCAENSYVSGFNLGYTGDASKFSVVAIGCLSEPGKGNWLGFGVNQNVKLDTCRAAYVRSAIYNDTGVTAGVKVFGFNGAYVEYGIRLIVPPGATEDKGHVALVASDFLMSGTTARFVELWDQNGGGAPGMPALGPLLVEDCNVTLAMETKDFWKWSIAGRKLHQVLFVGMRWPAGGTNGPASELLV